MRRLATFLGLTFCCLSQIIATANAHDWPMTRFDAQRSGSTPEVLPDKLQLLWTRQLPALRPAWPDQPKLKFDIGYDPVVVGSKLLLGSSYDDSVTAWSTDSGAELWRFYANGPVRFAPLAWEGKVYFASDDGYLYCLKLDDGSLLWKFRGGPEDRFILGNERLISMWPARGAPVIADGKLYFAAGIWPFMGIFIHALDATTGKPVWTNSGDGSRYMKQPHFSDAFAGVAPQGALVVSGDKLLIPGGRSVPACYDRHTGELLYYQLADNGKKGGGAQVASSNKFIFNGGAVFDLATEKYLGGCGEQTAFAGGRLYDFFEKDLRVSDLETAAIKTTETVDRKGVKTKSTKWTMPTLAKVEAPRTTCLIKSGDSLYVGSHKSIAAYSLPAKGAAGLKLKFQLPIDGTPHTLVAANKQLLVTTLEGKLYCFGAAAKSHAPVHHKLPILPQSQAQQTSSDVADILQATGVREGYALVFGGEDFGKLLALRQQSKLRLMVLENDADQAARLRQSLHMSGIGSDQIAILSVDLSDVELPPYLASLMLVNKAPEETEQLAELLKKTYATLRPYGGVAVWNAPLNQMRETADRLPVAALHGAQWKEHAQSTILVRAGALPGSGNWTHEHADAANTRVSADHLVKAPLGLLWFGGTSNEGILPRHGHGPQPQVIDGRLFIEGVNMLRAIDIYTGRLLWETAIPGLGKLYDNTAHQPGANAIGTNYNATADGIYVINEQRCLKLDPATGKQLAEFRLPALTKNAASPRWGYLNISGDYLIGGAEPLYDPSLFKAKSSVASADDDPDPVTNAASAVKDLVESKTKIATVKEENDNYSSSKSIVVMNRQTGKVLWSVASQNGFRHNSICVGGGRLYCIDRLSGPQLSRYKRRGETPVNAARLLVLDLATGQELWSSTRDIFGTWLSYSIEYDVLVEAGRTARDTLSDEARGMRAYNAKTGQELWYQRSYLGPAMLHHRTVLMTGNACDLLTGKPKLRAHPFNDEPLEWVWTRNYGCNTPMASEHLLTFRSGAAGYFDLTNDGGTGNFGGFRSSCTNNLVVAGGVLTAPDYTRSCTCSYQNQTSVALVHMPDAEIWTSFGAQTPKLPIKKLGVNLGAPGDRKASDGTLWIEYPSVGGLSPAVEISTVPNKPKLYRGHSSEVSGEGYNWVASSGAMGLERLNIKLLTKGSKPQRYTVRLYFAEPEEIAAGERVFDVKLQGQTVLNDFDILATAGNRRRTIVKEFHDVEITEELQLELIADATCEVSQAILSGVEVQAQDQ